MIPISKSVYYPHFGLLKLLPPSLPYNITCFSSKAGPLILLAQEMCPSNLSNRHTSGFIKSAKSGQRSSKRGQPAKNGSASPENKRVIQGKSSWYARTRAESSCCGMEPALIKGLFSSRKCKALVVRTRLATLVRLEASWDWRAKVRTDWMCVRMVGIVEFKRWW